MVKALLGEYNRAIREKLNQIVALLSREEFPKHFGELFEYMKHVLGKINEGLKVCFPLNYCRTRPSSLISKGCTP